VGRRAFKAQRGPVRPGYSPVADREKWAARAPYLYFVYLQLRYEILKTGSIGLYILKKIMLYIVAIDLSSKYIILQSQNI